MPPSIAPLAWVNGRTFWALASIPVTRKGRRLASTVGGL